MASRNQSSGEGKAPKRGWQAGLCLFGSLVAASIIAASVPAAAPVPALASAAKVNVVAYAVTSSPFVSSSSSKSWYRIPAIVKNAHGDLLAFAEKRDNNTDSDKGNFDIVMRKSTNGGRTWGTMKTVANDGRNKVSNPVPLLDPTTGDVLLISSIRNSNDTYKGVFLQRSTDGGNTFTSLLSNPIGRPSGWKGGLTGPGHGIVLQRGAHAGRILVAMGYKTRVGGKYGAYGIYSDDGGKTWRVGYDRCDTSGKTQMIEGTIAEMASGKLYIDYRDKKAKTPGQTRLCAFSSDGGKSLSTSFRRQSTLKIHSCEGSALGLTGRYAGHMLFSAPTFTSASDRSLRRDMGIFSCGNSYGSFGGVHRVEKASMPAAYSDLVQVNDYAVGVLYETGVSKWRERIVYRQLPLSGLLK